MVSGKLEQALQKHILNLKAQAACLLKEATVLEQELRAAGTAVVPLKGVKINHDIAAAASLRYKRNMQQRISKAS